MKLQPFFSYYGSKYKLAPKYPAPDYETIIEPFAGSACYSLLRPEFTVVLYDLDPVVAGVWHYLIHATSAEIMALPDEVETTDDVHACQEAKWLIGFCLDSGLSRPRRTPSNWARNKVKVIGWGEKRKRRIAGQLDAIRHWQIKNAHYSQADDEQATWFVDPPYSGKAGRHYTVNALDYAELGRWCQSRTGQVIACENAGATWLPFRGFTSNQSTNRTGKASWRAEAIWTNNG